MKYYIVNSDGLIQKQFPEFTTDIPVVWSPDSQRIVLRTFRIGCSGIVIMQPDGTNQKCLTIDNMNTPPVYIYGGSWSPDGKYIVFSSNLDGDYDIYAIESDGSSLIQLTNMPGDESEPVWSSEP
jgi:Tol biopolymer transport system component